eukprot:2675229-Rhodomonas_salina.1
MHATRTILQQPQPHSERTHPEVQTRLATNRLHTVFRRSGVLFRERSISGEAHLLGRGFLAVGLLGLAACRCKLRLDLARPSRSQYRAVPTSVLTLVGHYRTAY